MRRIQAITGIVLAAAITGQSSAAPVDPNTIAAIATLSAEAIKFFKSGANPGVVMTEQNHMMLRLLHDRLEAFEPALVHLYEKMDGVSEEIDRIIRDTRNDELRSNMHLYVKDLRNVFSVLSSGKVPNYLPPTSYKETIREGTDALMVSREDLNLPFLLLGMRMEKALYFGSGPGSIHLWEGINEGEGRKFRYRDRIAKMLDPNRENSLSALRSMNELEIKQEKAALKTRLEGVSVEYVTTIEVETIYPVSRQDFVTDEEYLEYSESVVLNLIDLPLSKEQIVKVITQQLNNDSHKLIAQLRLVEILQFMESQAAYALAVLDDLRAEERPNLFEPSKRKKHVKEEPEIQPLYDHAIDYHLRKLEQKANQVAEKEYSKIRETIHRIGHRIRFDRENGRCPVPLARCAWGASRFGIGEM